MCGICGIFLIEGGNVNQNTVIQMTTSMEHRGPDDEGFFFSDGIGFGMRRLKVVDLVTGEQPMCDGDNHLALVFNGEIYNHKEIRQSLENKGYKFLTNCDTEVLLHGFKEYGHDLVNKLNGMFCYAIWDKKLKSLSIFRDRLGEKPLYYSYDGSTFIFASELKAIIQARIVDNNLNWNAVGLYLKYGYIPEPHSIYSAVKKLPAASYLNLDSRGLTIQQYWSVDYCESDKKTPRSELVEKTHALLVDSVGKRLESDVPLGSFLSGGLDSSLLTGILVKDFQRELKTFSIDFESELYSESKFSTTIASFLGTDHHKLNFGYNDLSQLVFEHQNFEEPFADPSKMPLMLLSAHARKQVTVAMTGDGADEIFGGYRRYAARALLRKYLSLPKTLRKSVIERVINSMPSDEAYYGRSIKNKLKLFISYAEQLENNPTISKSLVFDNSKLEHLLKPEFQEQIAANHNDPLTEIYNQTSSDNEITKMMWMDLRSYLVDNILFKTDRATMAFSLEARTPYLDHRIVELMSKIPTNEKFKGRTPKSILREIGQKYLPKPIIERPKQGFGVPIAGWLRDANQQANGISFSEALAQSTIFSTEEVATLHQRHLKGEDHSEILWSILTFNNWQQNSKFKNL